MIIIKIKDDTRTKIIEDTVVEVRKAKRVLCASCMYGFYMKISSYNRNNLELMQVKLKNVFIYNSQVYKNRKKLKQF